MIAYPPQDLDCPDPPGCPVAVGTVTSLTAAGSLRWVTLPTTRHWYRVYGAEGGFAEPNPGYGDTRFAPFDDTDGHRVGVMYLAETLHAALLETSLHDVGTATPRVISEMTLLGLLHARIVPPRRLHLIDMRDAVLDELGLERLQFSASPAEHYPCTRRAARAIHATGRHGGYPDGILWHSRQAELTGLPPQEVAVVFTDRVPTGRNTWRLAESRTASGALVEGAGRARLDALAETLNITIVRAQDLDPKP